MEYSALQAAWPLGNLYAITNFGNFLNVLLAGFPSKRKRAKLE